MSITSVSQRPATSSTLTTSILQSNIRWFRVQAEWVLPIQLCSNCYHCVKPTCVLQLPVTIDHGQARRRRFPSATRNLHHRIPTNSSPPPQPQTQEKRTGKRTAKGKRTGKGKGRQRILTPISPHQPPACTTPKDLWRPNPLQPTRLHPPTQRNNQRSRRGYPLAKLKHHQHHHHHHHQQ